MRGILLCLLLAASPLHAADLVLLGGRIWTGDPDRPEVTAMAVRDGRVLSTGDDADVLADAAADAVRIDLDGRRVVPGINDAHVHLGAEPPATRLDLPFPEPDAGIVLAALRAEPADGDGWITGEIGGAAFADPRLDRAALDALHPVRPVRLASWSGHGTILNSAGQRALGIDPRVPVPGGWYGRDARGAFDGRLYEYAQWRARILQPPLPDEAVIAALRGYSRQAAQFGVTSLQAMAMMPTARFLSLWVDSGAPQRLRLVRFPLPASLEDPVDGAGLPRESPDAPRVRVFGTKWILDGTPIEQGAALRRPYPGGGRGRLNFGRDEIEGLLREALARDDQVLLHVSGDATAETVLDAMAAVAPAAEWRQRRLRMEHGDGLAADLVPRAREFGVVVVQNPSHFTIPSPFMSSVPLLSGLIEAGIPLGLGSDGPPNPWLNMQWAGELPASPGQALTREQVLRAYTAGSAFAEFAEGHKGRLAPGWAADFAVLSQDVLDPAVPASALPETRSLLTVIGGQVAWRDPAFRAPGAGRP